MGFIGNYMATERGDVNMDQNVQADQYVGDTSTQLSDTSNRAKQIATDTDAFATPLADSAGQTAQNAFAQYNDLFSGVVADAKNYDSPAELERVRQEAAGNANVAADVAENSRRVALQRIGVNPGSPAANSPDFSAQIAREAGVADAMNRAVADRRDKALALRTNAAVGAGTAASTFAGLGVNLKNAPLPALSASTQAMAAKAGLAGSLYSSAVKDAGQTLEFNKAGQKITANVIQSLYSTNSQS